MSTIQTTAGSSAMFNAYALLAEDCLKKHADVAVRMGVEMDEIRELRDTMWALEDAYKLDSYDEGLPDDSLGEDEES